MPRPQRVSDADRERVVDVLRVRCAQGYLSPDTLSRRLESTFRARTASQLDALVSDLPRRMRERARATWRGLVAAMAEWVAAAPAVTGGLLAVATREVEEASGRLVLGRSTGSDVRLADASVSRRHAEIRHTEGRWWIEDLGSLNGVVVNGVRVLVAELAPGDRVELGDLALRFEPHD